MLVLEGDVPKLFTFVRSVRFLNLFNYLGVVIHRIYSKRGISLNIYFRFQGRYLSDKFVLFPVKVTYSALPNTVQLSCSDCPAIICIRGTSYNY